MTSGKPTKDKAAFALAKRHYEIDAGVKKIFRVTATGEANPSEPIKLLEVSATTAPSGVMPLYFGPAPGSGIPYSSVIVEITPQEFEKLQRKELELPNGWTIGRLLPNPKSSRG